MTEIVATSDLIALAALGVSLLSLIATARATGIARDSVKHAERISEEAKTISIERERAALLTALADDVLRLDATRIEIEALKVEFEAKPQPVRVLLHNYTDLFGSYFEGVRKAVEETKQLYNLINNWSPSVGEVEFLKARTEHHRYSRDHEIVSSQAQKLIGTFREKMTHAEQYVAGAVR